MSGLIATIILLFPYTTYSQNEIDVDSMETRYLQGDFAPEDSLSVLSDLATYYQDPIKILEYSEILIEVAQRKDSNVRLYQGYLHKGNGYLRLGNQVDAIDSFFEAANYAEQTSDATERLGSVYVTIADTYSLMDNEGNAREYYQRAIKMLRTTPDSLALGIGLANAGDFYYQLEEQDSALVYFNEAGAIFKAIDYTLGLGYYEGSLGMIYGAQGRSDEALVQLNRCLEILEAEGDYYGVSAFLPFISDIHKFRKDYDAAIRSARQSLEIAEKYRLKEQIRDANLQLSELYELQGFPAEALEYYKTYITYKDSISNIGNVQQMARLRTNYEIDQKQTQVNLLQKEAEISELREKRQDVVLYIALAAVLVAILFAYGLFRRYKYIQRTKDIIAMEKSRSDELLKNILPEETADELKEHGRVMAKRFESVSVLFADFVGFTSYSEKMSPEDLVKTVDYYFSRFDQVVEKYGLEKIKTMGDCYMCAGGLPFPTEDHAVKMAQVAIEILEIVSGDGYSEVTGFQVRLGIHTGPVVAGVVGTKKFAYDIWGDTVNIASRMESGSLPGQINISESTYLLIKDHFTCEFRGMMQVKNRGQMKMYFIKNPLEKSGEVSHSLDVKTKNAPT